jgi:hypothetical protein
MILISSGILDIKDASGVEFRELMGFPFNDHNEDGMLHNSFGFHIPSAD